MFKRQITIQYRENTPYKSLNKIRVWSMDGDRGESDQRQRASLYTPHNTPQVMTSCLYMSSARLGSTSRGHSSDLDKRKTKHEDFNHLVRRPLRERLSNPGGPTASSFLQHHRAATLSHSNSVCLGPSFFGVRRVRGTREGLKENKESTLAIRSETTNQWHTFRGHTGTGKQLLIVASPIARIVQCSRGR